MTPENQRRDDAFAETLRILRSPDSRPGITGLPFRPRFALFVPGDVILFWQNDPPAEPDGAELTRKRNARRRRA